MKKLLSVFVVLGMVSSVGAIEKINVTVNAPAQEESAPSWENDKMSIEATVKPYDDERTQIDLTVSAKTDAEPVVLAKPRIITYMGDEASFVVKGETNQFEVTVRSVAAKEASMEVEVIAESVEANQEGNEEASQEA